MSLSILIINENESFCSFLREMLSVEGHNALCATGETESLRLAQSMKPDLIILEVSMPEISALATVKRLHRTAETRTIPLIVISDFGGLEFELLHVFDFIGKPLDLGRLREDLAIIAQGKKKRAIPAKHTLLSNEEHEKFHDYLITHCGLHFERRNLKILERGLVSRMAALQITSFNDYFEYLSRNKERRQELQKLLQYLAVGETFFFRYNAHFSALAKSVLPELASPGRKKRIRFWSAGCSTGEEPYSIAMTIMETIPDWRNWDIKILATDINNRSLKRAEEGVYTAWKLRVTENKYQEKYFRRIGESFVINDEVKSLVEFAHLNLQTAQLPSPEMGLVGMDAIFCRNVMIYFTLATTKEIVDKFAACLNPGGHLFLGHAETISQRSSQFERHVQDGGFYYRRRSLPVQEQKSFPVPVAGQRLVKTAPPAPVTVPAKPSSRPTTVAAAVVAPPPADSAGLYAKAMTMLDAESFQTAADLLDQVLKLKPDHAGALVAQGYILANRGKFQEALTSCSKALVMDDLSHEAYFIRGLVLDMTDRQTDAVEEYRKAILLKMDFVMPHYHLGKLFFRLGQMKDGLRELKNSLRLLEKSRDEAVIPYSGGLSRGIFLEQLRIELGMVETLLETKE
jgi:chemotaxis protein methyltransferase CheR